MSNDSVPLQDNPFVRRYSRHSGANPSLPANNPVTAEFVQPNYVPTDNTHPNNTHPDDTRADVTASVPEAASTSAPTSLDPPQRRAAVPQQSQSIHPSQSINLPHHDVASIPTTVETTDDRGPDFQPSTFSPASEPEQADSVEPPVKFTAAWEVEIFELPPTVSDLFFNGELFNDLAGRLAVAIDGGLRSMVISSLKSGQGRSTVAIGMALAAASQRRRVALVDADIAGPTLMTDLGIDADHGWLESIRGDLPMDETAILAIQDGVTLLPLIPSSDPSRIPRPDEIVTLTERLSDHFDLIIIDGGPSTDPRLQRYAAAADSVLIVRDAATDDHVSLRAFCKQLTDVGVKGIGLVENFG